KVEAEKRLNNERQRQQKRLAEIAARTKAMMASAGLSDRQYQQQIAIGKVETPAEKEALKKHFQQEESLRGNWEKGVKKGFAEFQDQATNAYANVANITQFAFEGMSHSLSDFLLTGKANFADFTKSLLEMIVKLMTQMAILKAMKSAFGGQTEGWRGAVAGILGFSSGGYVGGGGKYDPKGIVHGGEFVFTKEATQRLGIANLYRLMDGAKRGYASGGYVGTSSAPMYGMQPVASGVNVNLGGIHVDGQPQQSNPSNVDMRAAEQSLTQKIKSVLVAESRDGGDLHKIIKAVNGRSY
ncbi:MAG TPA: phage tail tape measure protein, partial [Arsenophonus apicola]